MAGSTIFPAYIRAEYDENGAFRQFESSARASASRAQQEFETAFNAIRRASEEGTRNAGGLANLNFNAAGQREAAQAAELQALKLRAAAIAAEELQRESNDLTETTRRTVQGFRAAAVEADRYATEQNQLAATLERVEQKTAGAVAGTLRNTTAMAQANQRGTRQSRNAQLQLGQQVQDVVVQAQAGTNALTIFAQQGSQVAFAMSEMKGAVGRVATFMSGPFGAAIFGASILLGGLITKLLQSEDAAKMAEAGADGLSAAQSALGSMFDQTSGRIENQNELLRLNARLMAINLRAEALAERAQARRTLADAGRLTVGENIGGLLFGNTNLVTGQGAGQDARIQNILRGLNSGRMSTDEALRRSEGIDYDAIGLDQTEFQTAIINAVSSRAKEQTAAAIDRSLDSGVLDPSLRRGGRGRSPSSGREGGGGASAASRLSEFGQDAADRIARLNDQFTDTPQLIARANQAMRQLDDLAEKLSDEPPPNYEALLGQIAELRPLIEDSINQPYRDLIDSQKEQHRLGETLLTQGEVAVEVMTERIRLERLGPPLRAEQLAVIEQNIEAERDQNREIEQRNRLIEGQVKQLQGIRDVITDIVANPLDIGSSLSALQAQFNQFSAESLVENLLGQTFRDLEDQLRRRSPLEIANDNVASSMDTTATHIETLGEVARDAANAIAGGGLPGGSKSPGAGDLGKSIEKMASVTKQVGQSLEAAAVPIVVTANVSRRDALGLAGSDNLSPRQLYNQLGAGIGQTLLGPLGKTIGSSLGDALQGAGFGRLAGGLVLGSSGSNAGSGIGGALGGAFAEKFLGKALGSLGQFAGPLGGIVGGIAGGLVGKLFGGTPSASANIGFSSPGVLSVQGLSGSKGLQAQAAGAAGSVIEGLQKIIEQLGGSLDGPINVSVGIRDGNFHVDTEGLGRTKKKQGAIDFGKDEAAAIEFAIRDAIKDGVITGMRQGSLNLLRGGGSLDAQISKALRFQQVFEDLAEAIDPVGYAVFKLNEEFDQLKKIFDEAGASTEEYAQLEQLYGIKREEAIKKAGEALTSTLRDLLDDLTVKNDARSLRTREGLANAELMPLLSNVEAGKKVDYDKFSDAARTALDIAREIYGSQEEYFVLLNRITDATAKALADQENLISIATGQDSPFAGSTGGGTGAGEIVTALDILGDRIVKAINDNGPAGAGSGVAAGGGGGGAKRSGGGNFTLSKSNF